VRPPYTKLKRQSPFVEARETPKPLNAIHVLSHLAGFEGSEAEILSYASQYTDPATEHKPIPIKNLPPEASQQTVRGTFDPVCSAHEALQYVTQWSCKDAQRKTYISFGIA
jgi:hypothetical protein